MTKKDIEQILHSLKEKIFENKRQGNKLKIVIGWEIYMIIINNEMGVINSNKFEGRTLFNIPMELDHLENYRIALEIV